MRKKGTKICQLCRKYYLKKEMKITPMGFLCIDCYEKRNKQRRKKKVILNKS